MRLLTAGSLVRAQQGEPEKDFVIDEVFLFLSQKGAAVSAPQGSRPCGRERACAHGPATGETGLGGQPAPGEAAKAVRCMGRPVMRPAFFAFARCPVPGPNLRHRPLPALPAVQRCAARIFSALRAPASQMPGSSVSLIAALRKHLRKKCRSRTSLLCRSKMCFRLRPHPLCLC